LAISDLKAKIGVQRTEVGGILRAKAIKQYGNPTAMNQISNIRVGQTLSVEDDPRWARILSRDKTADGLLWYSVSTTGIYCRPSCPSRAANPKNVALHDTLDSARTTGFRPCKRCNPAGLSLESENAALVAKACRIIEESEEEPSLDDLAGAVGRSASYIHRVFKAATGLTPKGYVTAHRVKKVREGFESGASVTEAIYDAGFQFERPLL
jgi:AraC family transcriptional regulator of adaptative response/methylated-DNA-[protein]-cysteine methyltransferase